jgi:hypothetical protein
MRSRYPIIVRMSTSLTRVVLADDDRRVLAVIAHLDTR